MTNLEFDKCIGRIKSGDKGGLRDIYEAYLSYIYHIAYGVLRSKEDAEDVAADFFIKLWEKADSFIGGGGHRAFLTVMARNMAVDFLRAHKREELTGEVNDLGLDNQDGNHPTVALRSVKKDTDKNPTEDAVIAEMSLNDALNSLSEAERDVVAMKIIGELTFKEIAQALDAPMGTVTWRYQNALKKLRRCGYE